MSRPIGHLPLPVGPARLTITVGQSLPGSPHVERIRLDWEGEARGKELPLTDDPDAIKFAALIGWLVTLGEGPQPPALSPGAPRARGLKVERYAELVRAVKEDYSRGLERLPFFRDFLTSDVRAVEKLCRSQEVRKEFDPTKPWQTFIELERHDGDVRRIQLRRELLPASNVSFEFKAGAGGVKPDLATFLNDCEWRTRRGGERGAKGRAEEPLRRVVREELESAIAKVKRELRPPRFEGFLRAKVRMLGILEERLRAGEGVRIRILGLAAKLSWQEFLEVELVRLFGLAVGDAAIDVEMLIVDPAHLIEWGQDVVTKDTHRTIEGVALFRGTHAPMLASGRLKLRVTQSRNIPQFHGVMIDSDHLFLGRGKWEEDRILRTSNNIYRHYTPHDHNDGNERIDLFDNWFKVYQEKGKEI
jgi:hypothetical protein